MSTELGVPSSEKEVGSVLQPVTAESSQPETTHVLIADPPFVASRIITTLDPYEVPTANVETALTTTSTQRGTLVQAQLIIEGPALASTLPSLVDMKAKYLESMIRHFYASLEGVLPLLLVSKRSPFEMLKTSLLYCIASVRTIGGGASAVPLEQTFGGF